MVQTVQYGQNAVSDLGLLLLNTKKHKVIDRPSKDSYRLVAICCDNAVGHCVAKICNFYNFFQCTNATVQ